MQYFVDTFSPIIGSQTDQMCWWLFGEGEGIFLIYQQCIVDWREFPSTLSLFALWGRNVEFYKSLSINLESNDISHYVGKIQRANKYVLRDNVGKSNSENFWGVPTFFCCPKACTLSIDMWPKQLLIEFIHTMDGYWVCGDILYSPRSPSLLLLLLLCRIQLNRTFNFLLANFVLLRFNFVPAWKLDRQIWFCHSIVILCVEDE